MTQVPKITTGALSPADDIAPAVLDRTADAIFREHHTEAAVDNGDTVWMRYARAAIAEIRRIDAENTALPRDWRVNEIGPGTPYADEPTAMIPPGVYLAAGFTGDPEDGPGLILRVEQVSGANADEHPDMADVAHQIADRLNGGGR